jgi:hypothetical protein
MQGYTLGFAGFDRGLNAITSKFMQMLQALDQKLPEVCSLTLSKAWGKRIIF